MIDTIVEQTKEDTIDSVCIWLSMHAHEYIVCNWDGIDFDRLSLIEDLRKAIL